MGFVIVIAITLYLLISIGVVVGAVWYARKHGKSAKRWGWSAALVMYLIPFWDWIPTVVVHQYYCATESGFWVYKTLDQWMEENPGVAETLVANKKAVTIQNAYVLNQRFNWAIYEERFFPLNYMIRREEQVVDSKTGDVLARYIDFSTAQIEAGGGWYGWKFWLNSRHCKDGKKNSGKIATFLEAATYIGNMGEKG